MAETKNATTRGWVILATAAVVILVILLLAVVSPTRRRYGRFISGMWTGDPTFLRKAGLSDMQLYISPSDRGGKRQGYLIMADENGRLIANQAFEMTEKRPNLQQNVHNHFQSQDRDTRDVDLKFDGGLDPALLPSELTMSVSMADGSMSLYSRTRGDKKGTGATNKLYGFLWKDAAASSAARTAENAAPEG